jgi:peptide/nickel transport system permease protein
MRWKYLGWRLVLLIPVVFGITVLTFVVSHVVPADPVAFVAGERARGEQIERLRKQYGLDRPLPLQYVHYVGGLLRGDLGRSLVSRRDVIEDLTQYLPATIELTLAAMVLIVLVGVPLGVLNAIRQDTWLDHTSRVLSMVGISMPTFWLGLLFQLLFYRVLAWLPIATRLSDLLSPPPRLTGLYTVDALLAGQPDVFVDATKHLVLPAVTLCVASLATVSRQVRSAMLEVLRQPYIRTAHAKGLYGGAVVARHALRNALIPTVTIIALQTGSLLSGAVLTETVFSWPGLGLYALRSVLALDYHPVMSVALVVAVMYTLVNLGADLLYAVIDPRVEA